MLNNKTHQHIDNIVYYILSTAILFSIFGYLGFKIESLSLLQNYGFYYFFIIIGTGSYLVFKLNNNKISEKDYNNVRFDILIVFILALYAFLGLYKIGVPTESPDTIQYLGRGIHYLSNKLNIDIVTWYTETFELPVSPLTGTPGVTSAVTSAISIIFFGKNFDPIISARIGHVIVNLIFLILFYLLSKKIFNQKIAVFSTLALGLNPYFIALSRIPNPDSLLPFFTTISILFLYLSTKNYKYIFPFTLFLCLALLTKLTSLFLLPVMIIWIYFETIKKTEKDFVISFILNKKNLLLVTSIFISIFLAACFWPSLNGDPSILSAFKTLLKLSGPATSSSASGSLQVLHQEYTNWPFHFYFVLFFVRLPAFTILLLLIGIKSFYKNVDASKWSIIYLALLIGILLISFTDKKGDKYHLFLYPLLSIIIGYALYHMYTFKLQFILYIFLAGVIINSLVYTPYFFESYNSLTNYGKNINSFYPAGWGDGHKKSMKYIQNKYGKFKRIYLFGYPSTAKRYYEGKFYGFPLHKSNLILFYNSSKFTSKNKYKKVSQRLSLEKTIKINNVNLMYIFTNNHLLTQLSGQKAQSIRHITD